MDSWILKNIKTCAEIRIDKPVFSVGRNPLADLILRSSLTSRNHCQLISIKSSTLLVQDLGAVNGTFVNTTKLSAMEARPLKEGDTIFFGGVEDGLCFKVKKENNSDTFSDVGSSKEQSDTPSVSGNIEASTSHSNNHQENIQTINDKAIEILDNSSLNLKEKSITFQNTTTSNLEEKDNSSRLNISVTNVTNPRTTVNSDNKDSVSKEVPVNKTLKKCTDRSNLLSLNILPSTSKTPTHSEENNNLIGGGPKNNGNISDKKKEPQHTKAITLPVNSRKTPIPFDSNNKSDSVRKRNSIESRSERYSLEYVNKTTKHQSNCRKTSIDSNIINGRKTPSHLVESMTSAEKKTESPSTSNSSSRNNKLDRARIPIKNIESMTNPGNSRKTPIPFDRNKLVKTTNSAESVKELPKPQSNLTERNTPIPFDKKNKFDCGTNQSAIKNTAFMTNPESSRKTPISFGRNQLRKSVSTESVKESQKVQSNLNERKTPVPFGRNHSIKEQSTIKIIETTTNPESRHIPFGRNKSVRKSISAEYMEELPKPQRKTPHTNNKLDYTREPNTTKIIETITNPETSSPFEKNKSVEKAFGRKHNNINSVDKLAKPQSNRRHSEVSQVKSKIATHEQSGNLQSKVNTPKNVQNISTKRKKSTDDKTRNEESDKVNSNNLRKSQRLSNIQTVKRKERVDKDKLGKVPNDSPSKNTRSLSVPKEAQSNSEQNLVLLKRTKSCSVVSETKNKSNMNSMLDMLNIVEDEFINPEEGKLLTLRNNTNTQIPENLTSNRKSKICDTKNNSNKEETNKKRKKYECQQGSLITSQQTNVNKKPTSEITKDNTVNNINQQHIPDAKENVSTVNKIVKGNTNKGRIVFNQNFEMQISVNHPVTYQQLHNNQEDMFSHKDQIIEISDDDDDFSCSQIAFMSDKIKIESDPYDIKIKDELAELDYCDQALLTNQVPIDLDNDDHMNSTQDVLNILEEGFKDIEHFMSPEESFNEKDTKDKDVIHKDVDFETKSKMNSSNKKRTPKDDNKERRSCIVEPPPKKRKTDEENPVQKKRRISRVKSVDNSKSTVEKVNLDLVTNRDPRNSDLKVHVPKLKDSSGTSKNIKGPRTVDKTKTISKVKQSSTDLPPTGTKEKLVTPCRRSSRSKSLNRSSHSVDQQASCTNQAPSTRSKSRDTNSHSDLSSTHSKQRPATPRTSSKSRDTNSHSYLSSACSKDRPGTPNQGSSRSKSQDGISHATSPVYFNSLANCTEVDISSRIKGIDLSMGKKLSRNDDSTRFLLENVNVDGVIKDMVRWLPNWLLEQNELGMIAPINGDIPIHSLPIIFNSFDHYWNSLVPLIKLETWQHIYDIYVSKKRYPHRAVIKHTRILDSLMHLDCECYITEEAVRNNYAFRLDDFLLLEYNIKDSKNVDYRSISFGYVKSCVKSIIRDTTIICDKIADLCPGRLHTRLEFTVVTMCRPDMQRIGARVVLAELIGNIGFHLKLFKTVKALETAPLGQKILKPKICDFKGVSAEREYFGMKSLNKEQKQIVLEAASVCCGQQPTIYCIKGPPGTGKSTVIVSTILQTILSQVAQKNACPVLLVVAPSNAAIDELALKILNIKRELGEKRRLIKLIRLGVDSSINPNISEYKLHQHIIRAMVAPFNTNPGYIAAMAAGTDKTKFLVEKMGLQAYNYAYIRQEEQIFRNCNIICTTVNSCVNQKLCEAIKRKYINFTCCIIDEATQCTEVQTLLPTLLGIDKFVLVGDPKQLPATVTNMKARNVGYDQSLFSRLSKNFEKDPRNPIKMLCQQYRMHKEICSFPNNYFYDGKLRSSPYNANPIKPQLTPYLVFTITETRSITENKYVNMDEVDMIRKLLTSIFLVTDKSCKYSIGIITPYTAQKNMIEKSIFELRMNPNATIIVNTVDSFQGMENDIIIISCVRDIANNFVNNQNRLNVALTRAKQALYIVCNHSLFKDCRTLYDLREDAKRRNVCLDIKDKPQNLSSISKYILQTKNRENR